VLDALRLFADVARFAQTRLPVLKTQEGFGVCATYEMPSKAFCIPLVNIPTNDSDKDAKVSVYHENGSVIHIVLNIDRAPNVFIESEMRAQKNKQFFKKCFPESIIVIPTLGQLEESEKPNDPDYVRNIEHTRLAARNFRNIWRIKSHEDFDALSVLVESNWKKIEIRKPRVIIGAPSLIEMEYLEDGIPREVYLSGFGFQAWMQIMTHILRGKPNDILVLDEPDVYLHADLQRKLFNIIRKRFSQIFLATHSAEIMNEANSGDVVLIRPEFQTGKRITTEEGYRSAHALLGSSENADFARLSRAKRIIAFEGNDRSLYRRFEQMVVQDGVFSDPDTVMLRIGGYEQWPRVGNLPWAFEELFGISPKISAIFDRDYRCLTEIEEHESKLKSSGVFCHVLRRKEVENYVISTEAISKSVVKAGIRKDVAIDDHSIAEIMNSVAEEMKEDALINVQSSATKYFNINRDRRDTNTILKMAKQDFDSEWSIFGCSYRLSGKEFIAKINTRFQEQFKLSVSLFQILDEFSRKDLDDELVVMIMNVNNYFNDLAT
jgi:hypothetical protein